MVTITVVGGRVVVVDVVVVVAGVVVGALVGGVRGWVVDVVGADTGVVVAGVARVVVTEWWAWWCTVRGAVVVGAVVSLTLWGLTGLCSFEVTTANARPTATAPVAIHETIPRMRFIIFLLVVHGESSDDKPGFYLSPVACTVASRHQDYLLRNFFQLRFGRRDAKCS